MILDINKLYLHLLYKKAKEGFNRCINYKENKFLQNEINVPIESVFLKETSVRIVFLNDITNEYILEICLTLHAADKIIGKYTYHEDEKGYPVDDSLVFY